MGLVIEIQGNVLKGIFFVFSDPHLNVTSDQN